MSNSRILSLRLKRKNKDIIFHDNTLTEDRSEKARQLTYEHIFRETHRGREIVEDQLAQKKHKHHSRGVLQKRAPVVVRVYEKLWSDPDTKFVDCGKAPVVLIQSKEMDEFEDSKGMKKKRGRKM